MNNILLWPLSDTDKIVFSSIHASLATITCCDSIDLYFKTSKAEYPLKSGLTGCQLSFFKNELSAIVNQTKKEVNLTQVISVSSSKLGNVLIQMYQQEEVLTYFTASLETIQAWIAQLDLLEVVMQENENEKKSRGAGCC